MEREFYKVKEIEFPKFEDWYKRPSHECRFTAEIGFYSVFIGETTWQLNDPSVLYEAAIADNYHSSAANVYADKVVHFSNWIDSHDKEAIKEWYNNVTVQLNEKFAEYIKKTYLELDNKK